MLESKSNIKDQSIGVRLIIEKEVYKIINVMYFFLNILVFIFLLNYK